MWRPVSLLDLYPTLIDLASLPAKENLRGNSILPILGTPAIEWDRPALTYQGESNYTLRNERWRYIIRAEGTEELYDHDTNPQEWTNLASNVEYADVILEMKKHLLIISAKREVLHPVKSERNIF